MEFWTSLKDRNEILFWFGLANLIAAVFLIVISWVKPIEFAGTNAWHKPLKFAISTAILSWSMGWYTGYLDVKSDVVVFNWIIVFTLAFEVVYITFQASKGQASHYNLTTPLFSALYSLMAIAATVATLAVAYIGWKFFSNPFPQLPDYYLWSIRLGIVLFVIFSFEGFVMGSKLSHTVGGPDGTQGLPFLNWSRVFGDLRIAHFIGMHALQILPLLAWYLLKDTKLTVGVFILYTALAVAVLVQALQAKPLINS